MIEQQFAAAKTEIVGGKESFTEGLS